MAGNTATTSGPDVVGTFASQGNNLIGKTDGSSGWVGSDLTGTIAQPLNPLLAPLGNYGGPTQTMALLPGSPAIGAGSNGVTGVTDRPARLRRIVDGTVDIGAFESQGFTLTAVAGSTPQTANIGTAFANPLAVTVTANNPVEPVDGGVVSFAANPAANGASAILVGLRGRHRRRPGRRHRRAQQRGRTLHGRRVGLGLVTRRLFDLTNTGPVFGSA